MLSQSIVNKPAAGVLVLHCIGGTDVGLIGEKDDDRGLLAIARVSQHVRRDLATAFLISLWVLGEGGHPRGHAKPNQCQENASRAKHKTEQDARPKETASRRARLFHKDLLCPCSGSQTNPTPAEIASIKFT